MKPIVIGTAKACCKDPQNLGTPVQSGPTETFRRCMVCGCRHFRLIAEPGKYEALFSNIRRG